MERLSDRLTDVEYAKKGLALWFNNKPEESEEFFKLRLDSTPIFAAYSFVVCMVRVCLLFELFCVSSLVFEFFISCVSNNITVFFSSASPHPY